MAKIDTLFMSKTAEKPYPLEPHLGLYILTSLSLGQYINASVWDFPVIDLTLG